jgi:hypothetical protein
MPNLFDIKLREKHQSNKPEYQKVDKTTEKKKNFNG